MRLTRAERLAELVRRATLLRERIATGKDALGSELWREHPRNHKAIYQKYEPSIKEDAYKLVEVEEKIEKMRPKRLQK